MAAANESQGLKIAVAAFVSLTVILAVVSYFLYSNYDQTSAKLAAAETQLRTQTTAASNALTQYEELRKQIGSRAEEHEAVKAEISGESKKLDAEITAIPNEVAAAVNKVQAAGGNNPELQTLLSQAQQAANLYLSEPNKTYISSLARLKDLLKSQIMLATALANNYVDVRRSLESVKDTDAKQLKVVSDSLEASRGETQGEQTKHVSARGDLLAKVDTLTTERDRLTTEVATLNTKLRQTTEDLTKKLEQAMQNLREIRAGAEAKETVLDRPDGVVSYVDYNRGEVRTNITFTSGARPQMKFTIFDRSAPGIPTEKPKGAIELIQVGNNFSIARIVKTNSTIDPIRVGDLVYSPSWSPNDPMRFALIGKIDINRDSRDDRADLKRMIEASGGIVDYDLPPPYAGKETGKLTGLDTWYVEDDRGAWDPNQMSEKEDLSPEYAEFLKKKSEVVREARLNGVRPMPLSRLLNYLGYDFAAPIRGRAEAIDVSSMRNLLRARPNAAPKAAAAPEATLAP